MGKVVQAIVWIAGGLSLLVFVLPAASGYGYAVAMFPAYDQYDSCKDQSEGDKGAKKPKSAIREDDYRVYLLNRGCTIEDALKEIAADLQMDPQQLAALYRGEAQPPGADETWRLDVAKAQLHTFKSFVPDRTCPPDCGLSEFWGDDVISNLFATLSRKYLAFTVPIFLAALETGASHIVSVVRLGPLAQGALYLGYVLGLAVAASALYDLLKRALR